ncbi:GMC family oxidoreductase [Kineococcus sp. NUM-3379]
MHEETPARRAALDALCDVVVPAGPSGAWPSASAAGSARFLDRYLAERPDLAPRVTSLLDEADRRTAPEGFAAAGPGARARAVQALATGAGTAADWAWFAGVVSGGWWADPGNGGNDGAASWHLLGWSPDPAGGWPVPVPVATADPAVVHPGDLDARYDAVVVGSGAGGGVAACGLAESGRRVLVVERGRWPGPAELTGDHLRNPRAWWGLGHRTGPDDGPGEPRVLDAAGGPVLLRPSDPAWGNNAMTAGGGTRVYGAQAWRFAPDDFAMATRYGVPDGSALADWPITYADLEPFYRRAEEEVGVCGGPVRGPHDGPRSAPYPMPPLPSGPTRELLAGAAASLGWGTVDVPLLVNSAEHLGRGACARCRACVGFACPVDAKNGSQNTVLPRAFATGRCRIVLEAQAERLLTDGRGRVVGVALVGSAGGRTWRASVLAQEVVVAAGAVESARLLLNSRSDAEPDGVGNRTGQVGRHLQGHLYGGATGMFADEVDDLDGPGPSVATTDFRHGNPGIVGGGILANEFVPTPASAYRTLVEAGLVPGWGEESVAGVLRLRRRVLRVVGPVQEVTTAGARVRVDPGVRDRFGVPVARLGGSVHPEDVRGRDLLSVLASTWLRAAGAERAVPVTGTPAGPSSGQHQAGTCRMGTDPATSVVDPWGRVWGHGNLRVADASVHVTNGGVNPVLTVLAGAFRITDHLVGGWARPR